MRLVATSGDQMLSFPLRQGSTLIGRHPSCHVCIPAKGLSRRHCQCFVDGDTVVLRDLGSSNGTFVNNAPAERIELSDGDVVSLGGFQLRFDSEGVATQATGYAQVLANLSDRTTYAVPCMASRPEENLAIREGEFIQIRYRRSLDYASQVYVVYSVKNNLFAFTFYHDVGVFKSFLRHISSMRPAHDYLDPGSNIPYSIGDLVCPFCCTGHDGYGDHIRMHEFFV